MDTVFVGRERELEQFAEFLRNPDGKSAVLVGNAGMGKTTLLDRLADIAPTIPDIRARAVRFEVTPSDSPDSTLALIMDSAFRAAHVTEGSFSSSERRLGQWRALLNVIKIGDLVMSLRRDTARHTRQQFTDRMTEISEAMPDDTRALFLIDPEKYMPENSDQDWAIVIRDLPTKIKFVFAQRPEDALSSSLEFMRTAGVVRIPDGELAALDEEAVQALIDLRATDVGHPPDVLLNAIKCYDGHPYGVPAALHLIQDGLPLDQLPIDPTGKIVEAQWNRIREIHGPDAIRLFSAHAILDVAVPDEVAIAVSEVEGPERQVLLSQRFLKGLLRDETSGKRIYHAILADYILSQMPEEEAKAYHQRAIDIYRQRLTADVKPDALAAKRLALHVLEVEGDEAFVDCFIGECTKPLLTLGELDTLATLSLKAMAKVENGSDREAVLGGNVGLIEMDRGNFDRAEECFEESLARFEKTGDQKRAASVYGNLGSIAIFRGHLVKAEEWHRKSLKIETELGHLEGMASDYGNLGMIARKRGDFDKAEEWFRKGLVIEKELGRLEGIANVYGNYGLVAMVRGDLDSAVKWLNEGLKIETKLGRLEGEAKVYGNLGKIAEKRGEVLQARDLWKKAMALFMQIGMRHRIKQIQNWLDKLPPESRP